MEANCAACHGLDYIQMNPPFPSPAVWDAEVTKMIKAFGAPIEDAGAAAIKDYLKQTTATDAHARAPSANWPPPRTSRLPGSASLCAGDGTHLTQARPFAPTDDQPLEGFARADGPRPHRSCSFVRKVAVICAAAHAPPLQAIGHENLHLLWIQQWT